MRFVGSVSCVTLSQLFELERAPPQSPPRPKQPKTVSDSELEVSDESEGFDAEMEMNEDSDFFGVQKLKNCTRNSVF